MREASQVPPATTCIFFLCSLLALAPALPAASAVSAQAQKVLENHLRARGGLKAYQRLKTRRTMSVARVNNTEVKTVTVEFLADGKFLQTLELPNIGKTEVGFDGRRLWQRSSASQGLLEEGDARARAILRSFRAAELWDYKKDDRRFEYGGKEKRDGVEYEVLQSTYTTQDGKDVPAKYYFDARGLLRLIASGEAASPRLEFADFRPVDGITYAFHTRFVGVDSVVETAVEQIQHNVPVDPSIFEFRERLDLKP